MDAENETLAVRWTELGRVLEHRNPDVLERMLAVGEAFVASTRETEEVA